MTESPKKDMNQPTQVDVAKRAGVSRATVSYIINGKAKKLSSIPERTQQRVLEAINELGYEPDARARALRSGSTNTIALMIPDLRNPHFGEYATGIEEAAREAGYHLLLSSTTLNDEFAVEVFKDLARRRFDGLIITGSFILKSEEAQTILARIRKRGLPIVEMNEFYGVDSVSSDYYEATKTVVTYLLSLGHRQIGFVYGVEDYELGLDRLQPYKASLEAAGIVVDQSLIIECGSKIEDGYQAAVKLLQLPHRPTAIIAINDLLAISTIRAAGDLGLQVPNHLSVVGFDDIPMANYQMPRLTTVTKDAYAAGRKAFEMLQVRMQNPSLARQVIHMPVRLIIRESTGPVPL